MNRICGGASSFYKLVPLTLAMVFVGLPTSAPLAETECTQLLERLDQVEALGGLESTEKELQEAEALYEELSCPKIPTDPGCRDLSTRINRLQSADTEHGNLGRERQRLKESLERAGCMREGAPANDWESAIEEAENPEVFKELQQESGEGQSAQEPARSAPSFVSPGGGYRTLCVRTCDGYYWPVSFSTGPSQFSTDAATCHATCPNQEVMLYYHRPGTPGEEAVSASGNEPYSSLANALRYRTKYEKSCQCVTPELPDPATVMKTQERELQDKESLTKRQREEATPKPSGKADIYRSTPVIISPDVSDQNTEKSKGPNGLRGVSPAPPEAQ